MTIQAAQEAAFLFAALGPVIPPPLHDQFFMLAQATPTVPIAPTLPVDPNSVVIPYGAWLDAALSVLLTGVGTVAAYMLRWLPGRLYALAMTMQAEQLLTRAITYGINATRDAARDKTLDVRVTNEVLRQALTYALTHAPALLRRFMGSEVDIAEKIFARLPVAPEVGRPELSKIAAVSSTEAELNKAARVPEGQAG